MPPKKQKSRMRTPNEAPEARELDHRSKGKSPAQKKIHFSKDEPDIALLQYPPRKQENLEGSFSDLSQSTKSTTSKSTDRHTFGQNLATIYEQNAADLFEQNQASLFSTTSTDNSVFLPRNMKLKFLLLGVGSVILTSLRTKLISPSINQDTHSQWTSMDRKSHHTLSSSRSNSINPDENFTHFRLQVPFYIYDHKHLNWSNTRIKLNESGVIRKPPPDEVWNLPIHKKHCNDYWFYKHAMNHPMRTQDPKKAKLFYVPVFLNMISGHLGNMCLTTTTVEDNKQSITKCGRKLVKLANEALQDSVWFQRNEGRDHVVVDSHWRIILPIGSPMFQMNQVIFESHKYNSSHIHKFPAYQANWTAVSGRYGLSTMYTGTGCDHRDKTNDLALIASMHTNQNQSDADQSTFQSRRDICTWIARHDMSKTVCGRGVQCPALAQAKFGFHVRGDTWGANRLIDTLLSRTVPLFTNKEQYNILPDFVPFRELSFLIDVTNEQAFVRDIRRVTSLTDQEYETLLQHIDQYAPLFDHKLPYQFDMYMAQFAKLLGMQ